MKKPATAASCKQAKSTDESVKQLILKRVNNITSSTEDRFSNEYLDKHNEKETILDMVSKMPYRKFISKGIAVYVRKFRPAFYDELFRLTGLKRDPKHPSFKPHVFARLTLQMVYRRFPDGIIQYFEEENPADLYGIRSYKHFQLLNKLGEKKVLQFIEDAIRIMKASKNISHFWRQYGHEFGFPIQTTFVED